MTLRGLHPLAERQHGIFHIRQIDRLATIGAVRSAARRGDLVSVRRHVFRFAGTPATWQQSVLAAVLVAGEAAVASHATAAALWGLEGFRCGSSTAIHVTVPRGRHGSIDEVRVHTTRLGPGCHRRVVDRIAVTGVARTLCDLDGEVPDWRLARIVDDALIRRLVAIGVVAEVHAELRRGSRRSQGMARILAERGAEWDDAESPGEARLALAGRLGAAETGPAARRRRLPGRPRLSRARGAHRVRRVRRGLHPEPLRRRPPSGQPAGVADRRDRAALHVVVDPGGGGPRRPSRADTPRRGVNRPLCHGNRSGGTGSVTLGEGPVQASVSSARARRRAGSRITKRRRPVSTTPA